MKLTVDAARCNLCGACVTACPTDMVRAKPDRIKIGHVACIECGHCMAICPKGAIIDEEGAQLAPVQARPSPEALDALIRSRRTTRRFRSEPVDPSLLGELIDAAQYAPSAANCQAQQYVVVSTPDALRHLRERIETYYRTFAAALADRQARDARLARLGLDVEAATHPHVLAAVPAFVKAVDAGRDRLFFDAPAVVVIHADPTEVMPAAACAFAAFSIVLMAEAHGLGSCITGYASDALRMLPDVRHWLGMPETNEVHYVLAVGHPAERYHGIPPRRAAFVRWM
ncbi:MAG TPA: nitroreductase family protein [Armatimonadota bacterium]|nr:nitroreductase family protein [Armatimonadota bacterium]HQK94886.1 nitroreductase family protein [Armatimonadota bacterium]